jgi:hypothetical protein
MNNVDAPLLGAPPNISTDTVDEECFPPCSSSH